MELDNVFLKKLDKFGPYGSALGVFVGFIIWFFNFAYMPPMPFFIILAYALCTCTHRKYLIYSHGALGGAIGVLMSSYLGILLMMCPLFKGLVYAPIISYTLFNALFAFLFAKVMCRFAQKVLKRRLDSR